MLAVGLFSSNLLAQKPWKSEKPVAEWSQEELLLLLNDSPWTRKVVLQQLTGRRIINPNRGDSAAYKYPPTDAPYPELKQAGMERMRTVYAVRWSSSPIVVETLEHLKKVSPVLAGLQAPPPELSSEYFVLTVRVIKPPTSSANDRPLGVVNINARVRTAPDILSGLSEEELLNAAELRTNRKLRLKPRRVVRHGMGAGAGVSFYFPRQQDGAPTLSPNTKWAEFRFKGNRRNNLKTRFNLKEMEIGDH